MMTFSLYVVLVLESYLIVLLSTVSEIKEFDHSTGFKIFSLVFALIFGVMLTVSIAITILENIKAYPSCDIKRQWYFREIFNGLKNNAPSRMCKVVFIVVRIWFVMIVVVLSDLPVICKTIIFSFVQLASFIYIVIFRPFESKKDSIIEISNQFIFLVAASLLIHFDTKSEWSSGITTFYVYLILVGPMIGTVISLVDLIVVIYKRVKAWKKRNSKINDKVKMDGSHVSNNPISRSKLIE
jgi:hypothetical protein